MFSAIPTRVSSHVAAAVLLCTVGLFVSATGRESAAQTRRVKAARPEMLPQEVESQPIGKGVATSVRPVTRRSSPVRTNQVRATQARTSKVRTVQAEIVDEMPMEEAEATPLPEPARKRVVPSPAPAHGTSIPEIVDDWFYETDGYQDGPVCSDCQVPTCCGPTGGLYLEGQYLSWWIKGGSVPPLITTSPDGTAQANAGRLGLATTSVVVGGDAMADEQRNGYRAAIGYWFGHCNAIELSFFQLGDDNESTTQTSTGSPILARPFYNVNTVAADAVLIAFPNVASGTYAVSYESQMQGGEALLRHLLFQDCMARWDVLVGYRQLTFDEQLTISDDVLGGPNSAAPGARVIQNDIFRTENEFNGVQFGLSGDVQHCRWSLRGLFKVALGNTQSTVNINGSTTNIDALGGTANGVGGVLALPSNIGAYEQNKFTVIPEIDVTLSYHVTPCLRASIGYTLIFWGNVARPGDQIDLQVNPNQFFPPQQPVGLLDPSFALNTTSFWAQGINAGLEYRF